IVDAAHEYEHDPRAESYGVVAAERLGVDPARVFKTLVADLDGSLEVAVVPVAAHLDLRTLGGKRSRMAERRDVERMTGYVLGGVSPLGQRRPLATTVDSSALDHDTVFVSAGRRGLELELDPRDLVGLRDGGVRAIARQAIG